MTGNDRVGESTILEHFRGLMLQLVREVASEVRASNQGEEWIDQFRSPLRMPGQKSSRRHCLIVARRVEQGLSGAYISPDRKQFFLTTQALAEEMLPPLAKVTPPETPIDPCEGRDEDDSDGYARVMRLVKGGR